METSATPQTAVRAAFSALIDYAGLFPPAGLNMADAVAEYAAARGGAHAWMLGRFIVPSSRLRELLDALPAAEPAFPLSVICDRGFSAPLLAGIRAKETRVRIEALEIPAEPQSIDARADALCAARLGDLPAYVEWPRGEAWMQDLDSVMRQLHDSGLGAKLRCGGVTQEHFPQAEDIAAFIASAAASNVPYKATAGLHHPIRHFNAESGLLMHGFMNVLFASVLACQGASKEELTAYLLREDAASVRFDDDCFQWGDRRVDCAAIQSARLQAFVSYGSCSFDEPVEDLQALGVL